MADGTFNIRELVKGDDEAILRSFYDEIMIPSFPIDDERESLESMLLGLEDSTTGSMTIYRFNIAFELQGGKEGAILGGVCSEYYKASNCALITYIAVAPAAQGKGLSRALMGRAVERAHRMARGAGHEGGCAALLAETNAVCFFLQLLPEVQI